MASVKFAYVVVLCMVVVAAQTVEGIKCRRVEAMLAPCAIFLQYGGPVPVRCCSAVRILKDAAAGDTLSGRYICNCLKVFAGAISGLNPNNAEALPGKCEVNMPYKISTSTNCDRYISFLM